MEGVAKSSASTHIDALGVYGPLASLTSSSAITEKPRDESAILREWVTLRLNFRLKGYVSRQYLPYGPLDGGMVILQLCRWKFSHKETL